MRLRRTLAAALLPPLLAAATLAGCSDQSPRAGDHPSASASASSSSSASASSSATSSASANPSASPDLSPTRYPHGQPTDLPHARLAAAAFHVAALESTVARTPEQNAVVDSWMRFMQAQADTYYYGQPVKDLLAVSTGEARTSVTRFLAQQKHLKERSVGWARDNITSVDITGSRATIRDCTRNFTFMTDLEGEPITTPPPWYDSSGTLEKRGGTWVVTSQGSQPRDSSCLS